MRRVLAVLPLVAMSACSGGGPETVGGTAAPASATAVKPVAGNGSGVSAGNSGSNSNPAAQTSFLSLTAEKSFDAIGGFQSYQQDPTKGTLYTANASTVRAPSGQISYNPRDGIFTVKFTDTKADIDSNVRFQDPAHRTDFNGRSTPQWGVPDLQNFNYMEAIGDTPDDNYTFFYQRPGTSTVYVSLAGYVRNNTLADSKQVYERGALVFGDQTVRAQVPVSGGGTYTGGFLASMVFNPSLDARASKDTYYQWVQGSSTISVDFAKSTVGLTLNGSVTPANFGGREVPDNALSIPTGSTFNVTGSATIDLVKSGGFTGEFQSAAFTNAAGKTTPVDFARVSPNSSTAGASSIDGTFYGPDAVNVGGNMRIVGGIPDQRVDILGAFTGAKQP